MIQQIKRILWKKRNENQKQFFVGLAIDAFIFVYGIILLIFPTLLEDANLKINNYIVVMLALFALGNLIKYIVFNDNTNEKIYICLLSCAVGILNIILCGFLDENTVFDMSIMIFTLTICGVKLFGIDYYHERKDSYWCIETMLLVIFVTVGIVIALTVLSNNTYQVLSLGFFTIIISILDVIGTSIKCMLKSHRFIRNIKLK